MSGARRHRPQGPAHPFQETRDQGPGTRNQGRDQGTETKDQRPATRARDQGQGPATRGQGPGTRAWDQGPGPGTRDLSKPLSQMATEMHPHAIHPHLSPKPWGMGKNWGRPRSLGPSCGIHFTTQLLVKTNMGAWFVMWKSHFTMPTLRRRCW